MKTLVILAFLFIGITLSGQITFEKGYYINYNAEKIEGFIRNVDWRNNPQSILFKDRLEDDAYPLGLDNINAFEIEGGQKFQKFTVSIDRSKREPEYIGESPKAEYKIETLFLKVILEGPVSLYSYRAADVTNYFISQDGQQAVQLLYKPFKSNGKIKENNKYRKQLYEALQCDEIQLSDVADLNYKLAEIKSLFFRYAKCTNTQLKEYKKSKPKGLVKFRLRAGVANSSVSMAGQTRFYDYNFDRSWGLRIGSEIEYTLPFNKNKWALITGLAYQTSFTEAQLPFQYTIIDYDFFEIPFGVRHYIYLNENNALFLNAFYLIELTNSMVDFDNRPDLDMGSSPTFAFGTGFRYNKKIGMEIRYTFNRDALSNYASWDAIYNSVFMVVDYTF